MIFTTLKGDNRQIKPNLAFEIIKLRLDDEDYHPNWPTLIKHLVVLDICVDEGLFLDQIKGFKPIVVLNYQEQQSKYSKTPMTPLVEFAPI